MYPLLEPGRGDSFSARKHHYLTSMLTAPCHRTLETSMTLVRTDCEDIEIHFLNNLVNITILHHAVNISHTLHHVHTLLSAVNKFTLRLILQHHIGTLYGNGEMISNLLGTAEQLDMTDVQQIIYTNSEYSLHHS